MMSNQNWSGNQAALKPKKIWKAPYALLSMRWEAEEVVTTKGREEKISLRPQYLDGNNTNKDYPSG